MPIIISKPRSTPPPARYWRIVGLPTDDLNWFIAELAVAASVGGANIIGSASVTSPDFPGNIALLHDNDTATEFNTALGPGWTTSGQIVLDFGGDVSLAEVRITALNGANSVRTVRCFAVHASSVSNFATFDCHGVFGASAAYTAAETKSFALSATPLAQTRAAALAWRVSITNNDLGTAEMAVSEQQWAASPGGSNIATGGAPFQGRSTASLDVKNTVDADFATYWQDNSTPHFLGYVFPTPPGVEEVRLAPQTGATGRGPKDGAVEWSNDLINWTSAASFTGKTYTNSTFTTISVP